MYFDAEMRGKIIAGETEYQDTDSHTSIAHWYGFRGRAEDTLNKYEYNPLTLKFTIDQLNTIDDSAVVEKLCNELDFSTIVPGLVIKPIIHPLRDIAQEPIVDGDVALLREWDSVRASVRVSVWDSVWDSVRDSVGASVRDSVWASVWDSVGASVGASIQDSVRAYLAGFFVLESWKYTEHKPGQNPFQSCIDLWERGLVPSCDGKTWRLHAGPRAEVVYERSRCIVTLTQASVG